MVEETFVDWETSPRVSSFTGWRCVTCGEILDPIILQNRTPHPEPQYGRARLNKAGIMLGSPIQKRYARVAGVLRTLFNDRAKS
jgi:hypothetical protein